jgi:hypothetical protein
MSPNEQPGLAPSDASRTHRKGLACGKSALPTRLPADSFRVTAHSETAGLPSGLVTIRPVTRASHNPVSG